ncbi:ATP-grasp domain-containing protein [Haloplanus aerogenes]|uniref:ATP-grasp domain-containing protein n=1 Tax=Haloplanus aerogenes TaxID=660522 RepID=A0A3M0CUF8_9EURY|nr:ATP-grasp domain-containing protein [Haloplanus aerogenes]AZH26952.1 ATP-grasp domain-containing protein [Haloplanus aerogenes]RMB12605.1 ribosomal protein S6--L-glutamate ligase [Haloplanus aerogenes]
MLRLAVTSRAETFDRLRDPLAARDIEVAHLPAEGRTIRLDAPPAETFDVGFVYPSRTQSGDALAALHNLSWVNGREAILSSRNKGGVLTTLGAADLPVPKTTMVATPVDEADLVAAMEGFDWPVVVKPNSTTRGTGVAKATDLDSLLGIVDYLDLVHDYRATGDKTFLLQEYLPDARDYRVMVVDGAYAGAVERRLSDADREDGRWKHNVHRGAEAVGVDLPDEYRRLAERTADALDIDYLGVDLLVTDDRVVVAETNARPTVDSATKYVDDFYDRLAGLIRRTARE